MPWRLPQPAPVSSCRASQVLLLSNPNVTNGGYASARPFLCRGPLCMTHAQSSGVPPAVDVSAEALEDAHNAEARVLIEDGRLDWKYKACYSPVSASHLSRTFTMHRSASSGKSVTSDGQVP